MFDRNDNHKYLKHESKCNDGQLGSVKIIWTYIYICNKILYFLTWH